MAYFPLFVDLKDKNVLVVGGGGVAYRKVIKLLPFEANITLVAPEICVELEEVLSNNPNLIYKKKTVTLLYHMETFSVNTAYRHSIISPFSASYPRERIKFQTFAELILPLFFK